MRVLLAALMVLFALIIEGDCLICEKCFEEGATNCNGPHEECSGGITYCIKGLETNIVYDKVQTFAYKGCIGPEKEVACNRNIIHRNNNFKVHIVRECCAEDSCNTGDVNVPAIDSTPNGLKCTGCLTGKSRHGCKNTHEVLCTGNENSCATYTGVITTKGGSPRGYTHSGCNNQDACDAGVPSLESPYISDTVQVCSRASPA